MNTLQEDQDNSLTLGLGFSSSPPTKPTPKPQQLEEPSLTLTLAGGEPCSGAGSVSVVSVKRERESGSSDDVDGDGDGDGDGDRGFSRVGGSDEDDNNGGTRKKLRLTKQQSAMLEDSFKLQSTLNPKQKQALAERLSLRPRQVEVWFQNRRARTKLKQTEVDCEYLKKYCETLTEENRRLEKEVQELKALKLASPFYMHVPAATLTMCPSCERVGAGGSPNTATTAVATIPKNAFSMGPQTHHFLAATPNNCPLLVDN